MPSTNPVAIEMPDRLALDFIDSECRIIDLFIKKKSVHVLVVDDEDIIRKLLQDAITHFGYHCTVAEMSDGILK